MNTKQLLTHIEQLIKSNSEYLNTLDGFDSEEVFDDILYGIQENINTFKLRQEIGYNSDKN